MTILVVNCNHWIGYHITNTLLEKGYQIDVVEDKRIGDHLSLFFGRNNNVQFIDSIDKSYDVCIAVGEQINEVESPKKLIIQTDKEIKDIDENSTLIHPPLLFGEWMPMNEKGCFQNNHHIPFDSVEFKENALSVHVFTSLVTQWLELSRLPRLLHVNPNGNDTIEHAIFTRDDSLTEDHLNKLIHHYKKYRNFY